MTTQLNTLIRLRQYEVDRGQTQLASAVQLERLLAERLAELDQQIELHRTQLSALSRTGQLNIDAIRLRQQYIQSLAARRDARLAEFAAAQLATQQQRERLIAADQRLQVAEKLRERALRECHSQFQRDEARATEEAWQTQSHTVNSRTPSQ